MKTLISVIAIVLLFTALLSSCCKADINPMLLYNDTQDTIAFSRTQFSNMLTLQHIAPCKYYEIASGSSCSLFHLFPNGRSIDTVVISINGICVAKWGGPLITRPDSICHSYFNLQSWEERNGEKKNERVRFVFTITANDLNQ